MSHGRKTKLLGVREIERHRIHVNALGELGTGYAIPGVRDAYVRRLQRETAVRGANRRL